uniref:Uncharacterized protein n=1 Tax=Odontella aurita TaxID=265563 RepID=A0A7S4NAY5_9STRA
MPELSFDVNPRKGEVQVCAMNKPASKILSASIHVKPTGRGITKVEPEGHLGVLVRREMAGLKQKQVESEFRNTFILTHVESSGVESSRVVAWCLIIAVRTSGRQDIELI